MGSLMLFSQNGGRDFSTACQFGNTKTVLSKQRLEKQSPENRKLVLLDLS